jgi:hypothetical protein
MRGPRCNRKFGGDSGYSIPTAPGADAPGYSYEFLQILSEVRANVFTNSKKSCKRSRCGPHDQAGTL